MPVYRRKDKGPNVWQVQVSVKGQRTIKLFTGTKPEARTFERQVRADLEHQAADRRKVPTFSEFSNGAYSARARVELAAATWQNREYKLATLEQHFASLKLTEISATHIDTFVMAQRAAGMKGSTIADYLKILKVILNFAVDQKVLRELPTFPRVKIKGSKGRQPFWTREEVDRLLASAATLYPPMYPVILLLATTGCRKTEAIRLRWQGVDVEKGEAWVEPVGDEDDDDRGIDWTPKDNEARPVPLDPKMRPFLDRLREQNDARETPCPFVFATRSGGPYATWPQKQFDACRRAAGLDGGPHTLRHTYATHFLAARPDLFTLGRILGQSTQRVTELYSHLLPGAVSGARGLVTFAVEATPDTLDNENASRKASVGGKGRPKRRNKTPPDQL
jgi:integrase